MLKYASGTARIFLAVPFLRNTSGQQRCKLAAVA